MNQCDENHVLSRLKTSYVFLHTQEFKHLAVDIYMPDAKTIKVMKDLKSHKKM